MMSDSANTTQSVNRPFISAVYSSLFTSKIAAEMLEAFACLSLIRDLNIKEAVKAADTYVLGEN